MTGSFACRVASKADLPDILRLYAQPDFDNGKVLALSDAESIFERIERYPNYKLYVAIHQNKIVGTLALLIMDNLGHLGALSAVIEDVAVDPAFQGRGIGRTMMRHALDVVSKERCYKVTVSSNLTRERSHRFYESLGLERHGYSFGIKTGAG